MPYEVWSDRDDLVNVQMMRNYRAAYEARSPRACLHAVRLANAVLFWPTLVFVLWGELRPEVPRLFHGVNDTALHFTAYLIFAACLGWRLPRC